MVFGSHGAEIGMISDEVDIEPSSFRVNQGLGIGGGSICGLLGKSQIVAHVIRLLVHGAPLHEREHSKRSSEDSEQDCRSPSLDYS